MARPQIEIDPNVVEKLAGIGCSMKDIALIVECSVDTLERRFADVITKGRAGAKMSLRRKQFELAMSGHAVMLIWLGKNMLGQSDKVEQKLDHIGLGSNSERAERVSALLSTAQDRRDSDEGNSS